MRDPAPHSIPVTAAQHAIFNACLSVGVLLDRLSKQDVAAAMADLAPDPETPRERPRVP